MSKLIGSRDNLIKFASTPTKNGRSSSLQNSPRSTDTFSCRRIFDESNLGIGNLSIKSHSTLFISEESSGRFGRSGNWSVENSLIGLNSSIFFQVCPCYWSFGIRSLLVTFTIYMGVFWGFGITLMGLHSSYVNQFLKLSVSSPYSLVMKIGKMFYKSHLDTEKY